MPNSTRVLILNGPNLGRLGSREPEIYGAMTLADLTEFCIESGRHLGLEIELRQTDSEQQLVEWLEEAAASRTPVVLNPAAFTHYSYPVRDACSKHTAPLVEVHLSNPHARESFRHTSVVSGVADGTIAGFGKNSYALALKAVSELIEKS